MDCHKFEEPSTVWLDVISSASQRPQEVLSFMTNFDRMFDKSTIQNKKPIIFII